MSIAGITADHLEFSANRTLAYAILATEAPNDYLRLYRMNKVLSDLRKMLPLLTAEFSQSFPKQQKDRLILRLQDAYKILAEVWDRVRQRGLYGIYQCKNDGRKVSGTCRRSRRCFRGNNVNRK